MNCPKCGREVSPEWEVCPFCRSELKKTVCPQCGKEISPEWEVCPFCRSELSGAGRQKSAFDLTDDVFAAEREELAAQFKYCKSCGAQVGKGAKFCTVCKCEYFYDTKAEAEKGATLKYCAACGAENPEAGKFCLRCGGETFLKAKEEYEARRQAEAERKKREEEQRKREAAEAEFSVGKTVAFGRYPKNSASDIRPLEWIVLRREGDTALLMTKECIDTHRYHESKNTYAESEVRAWLNGEFFNKAFHAEEQARIQTTCVDNSLASTMDTENQYVCENTYDKVFLMSKREIEELVERNQRRRTPTEYAKSRGVYNEFNYYYWALRTPFKIYPNGILVLSDDAHLYKWNIVNNDGLGIVAAINVRIY